MLAYAFAYLIGLGDGKVGGLIGLPLGSRGDGRVGGGFDVVVLFMFSLGIEYSI